MKKGKFTGLFLAAMAVLTACGGGGSSDNTTDYATKYAGTWKSVCYSSSTITDATTSAATNITEKLVITRTGSSTAKAVLTSDVFASSDTSCAQTSLGRIVWSGSGDGVFTQNSAGIVSDASITIAIDAQATVSGKSVDQVTITRGALSTSLSNAMLTVGSGNRFRVNTANFPAVTYKDITYVSGSTLTFGDKTGVATTQYPTTLGTGELIFTKQ